MLRFFRGELEDGGESVKEGFHDEAGEVVGRVGEGFEGGGEGGGEGVVGERVECEGEASEADVVETGGGVSMHGMIREGDTYLQRFVHHWMSSSIESVEAASMRDENESATLLAML